MIYYNFTTSGQACQGNNEQVEQIIILYFRLITTLLIKLNTYPTTTHTFIGECNIGTTESATMTT